MLRDAIGDVRETILSDMINLHYKLIHCKNVLRKGAEGTDKETIGWHAFEKIRMNLMKSYISKKLFSKWDLLEYWNYMWASDKIYEISKSTYVQRELNYIFFYIEEMILDSCRHYELDRIKEINHYHR